MFINWVPSFGNTSRIFDSKKRYRFSSNQ
nr:hypothetical protein [Enterococcus faecalis]